MLLNINKIIVKDRIRKDFGDIKELAKDIDENGLINPPVVTPDYELIAGERRLRACKHLGKTDIEVRIMPVKDAEHKLELEISENEVRKDFSKAERIDYARRLERIESLKAEKRMKAGKADPSLNLDEGKRTDEVVAHKLGIGGKDTYRKEKYISDNRSTLTPEDFADWDEGRLSTNKAYQKIKAELKRQNDIIAEKDAAIADCKQKVDSLQQELEESKEQRVQIQKETVYPDDYESTKELLKGYEEDYKNLRKQFESKVSENQDLRKQIETMNDSSTERQYEKQLQDSVLLFCSKVNTFIEKVGGYVWLSDKINEIPELERRGYVEAVNAIKAWADTMDYNINNKLKEIK